MTRLLREEIRQSRPFRSVEQEAYLNLARTASLLTDGLEKVLKQAGVSLPQYNVLRILRGAQPDGLCRNEVRERMISRMPDMTRLLDRMEAAGLVTRTRDKEDRRQVTTQITPRALRLLEQLDDAVAEEHQRQLGHMSRTDLRTLIDLLSQVRDRE